MRNHRRQQLAGPVWGRRAATGGRAPGAKFTGELLSQPAQREGHTAVPAQGKPGTCGYSGAEGLARVGSGKQWAPAAWLALHLLRLEGYSGTWALAESSTWQRKGRLLEEPGCLVAVGGNAGEVHPRGEILQWPRLTRKGTT